MDSPGRMLKRGRGMAAGVADWLPVVVVVAVLQSLALASGGYYLRDWGTVGLLLVGFTALLCGLGLVRRQHLTRWSGAAVAALMGYGLWSLLSVAWASNHHAASVEAARTLMYGAVLVLGIVLGGRTSSLMATSVAMVAMPACVAAYTLLHIRAHVGEQFLFGRLLGSLGYFNAEPAFLMLGAWIGIAIAADRQTHVALRVAAVGAVTLSAQVAVLAQSRGTVLALFIAAVVYFTCSPLRIRSLVPMVTVAAGVALAMGELTSVWTVLQADNQSPDVAIVRATRHALAGTALAMLLMATAALVDRRVVVPDRFRRATGRVLLVALGAGVLMGAAWPLAHVDGNPARQAWRSLTTVPASDAPTGSGRLSTLRGRSNAARVVLWRVALGDARRHPWLGVGADNFESTFYRFRVRVLDRYAQQPHSLLLEVLAERGVVGLLLFGTFVVSAIAGFVRALRMTTLSRRDRTIAAGCIAAITAWFVQAQLEWFWQFPVLTGSALMLTGVVLATGTTNEPDRLAPRWLRAALATTFALVALLGIAPQVVATRLVDQAADQSPRAALHTLAIARRLTPLDPAIARARADQLELLGKPSAARRALTRAISLDPDHWATRMWAARFYQRMGDSRRAQRQLGEAHQRNPRESATNGLAAQLQ